MDDNDKNYLGCQQMTLVIDPNHQNLPFSVIKKPSLITSLKSKITLLQPFMSLSSRIRLMLIGGPPGPDMHDIDHVENTQSSALVWQNRFLWDKLSAIGNFIH